MSLQVRALSFSYGDNKILSDISFTLNPGETTGLMGNTGSGKSTLIKHLNGLLSPDKGSITVDGFQASDKRGRRKVGILFQHPSRQLFEQTVFEDIAFGPKNYGIKGKKLENTVYEAAKLANLRKEVLTASPRKLSGGEQKLACFAGIIACSPDYIILDEPFAGVDSASCEKLAEAIRQLKSAGCGVLIVSHQPDIFPGLVDRILYLEEGKLRFDGSLESFAGIDPLHSPSVPALMIRLRTKGMDVSTTVFSAKEALEEILFACGIGK